GRVSLLHQPEDSRYVVHLLYGPPIQRGRCEVIEDLPVLYNVPVSVNLPEKVKKAMLVPDMQKLAISEKDGKLSVTVPKFQCHCAVVFEY
ncbi:MAG: beta-galactosidase, partial [Planctomycetes bacterium]|nr:beta-galactosidase [Planctomycetota bacterium]